MLGLARRDGNRRYYDLIERLLPPDVLARKVPLGEQVRFKLLSRYRAHGLLGVSGGGDILREEVELLNAPPEPPLSVAFLPPFDPLVWDRGLLGSLFGFDYVWELFIPQAKRRWGWYVLPILFRDRLVGRIEPRIDRDEGVVRVLNLWWEDRFDPRRAEGFVDAMRSALRAYLHFAGASRLEWAPHLGRERRLLLTRP